ncbi:MAG: exo-alpha-sialidase [Deltaproteobacteria bacterium]|nr:exo-alpha-sialidase [Deltaproteobacteria bacterium]
MIPASEAYIGTIFQTANGFALVDGVLYAVTDVAEWTGPSIADRNRISYGQLFRSVGPDGTLGDIYWLKEEPSPPAEGFPAYPAGDPELVKKIKNYFEQPGQEIQLIFTKPHPVSDDNHRLTEPTTSWSLEDGTLVRFYRDSGDKDAKAPAEVEETKSRRNYAVFSFDSGKTWTVPTRTTFPDACARSNAGKLPDGQVYVINNILPLSPKKGGRSLLAISLSRDGLNFDRTMVIRFLAPSMRYEGRAKSVGYQYPHSVVVGKDLWVMYSVNKEDIEVTRIPLKELI